LIENEWKFWKTLLKAIAKGQWFHKVISLVLLLAH